MWDYIAFFGYNFIFFLFALFVWHVFPRPVPYDYTTIPGLKPDPDHVEDGNLQELRSADGVGQFLEYLHQDYGPLASFYWGRKYVVGVASLPLWRNMVRLGQKIGGAVDIVPLVDNSVKMVPGDVLVKIYEKIRSSIRSDQSVDGDWKLAAEILQTWLHAEDSDVETPRKYFLENHSSAMQLLHESEQELVNSSLPEKTDTEILKRFRILLLWRAIKKCLTAVSKWPLKNETKQPESLLFSDWPEDSIVRLSILECISSCVPFDFITYSFNEEIDLEGHPIPAGTPIIVYLRAILKEFSKDIDSASIVPDRMDVDSNALDQCICHLPYMDLLSMCVLPSHHSK